MLLSVSGAQDLRRDLRKDIAAAMRPMRQAVQSSVRAIPVHGVRHTGLRADVARATRIRVLASSSRAEVLLEVAPGRMPAGKQKLPAYLDGNGRWRHPVFGSREHWVAQDGHPYFWRGVEPHLQDVRDAVVEAVEKALGRVGL